MSQRLIDLNDDLRRLRDEGFQVEIVDNHLVVRGVPYLTATGEIEWGDLISTLSLAGDKTLRPDNHVAFFAGGHPCHKNGTLIQQLLHQEQRTALGPELSADRSFSNKPAQGYEDYYHKMSIYADIISGPAFSIDQKNTPRRHLGIKMDHDGGVFEYIDTASSRAGIGDLVAALRDETLAIVGLGGTGAYILDLVAKTPVKEIRIFDHDVFSSHNAFRAPGAPSLESLQSSSSKVAYFSSIYSKMHRGIRAYEAWVDAESLGTLDGCSFVFLAVDGGRTRKAITDYLITRNIPFIDTGLGLHRLESELGGQVRVTSSDTEGSRHVAGGRSVPFGDLEAEEDDLYRGNIQIAELNALAAVMAVIKWKKMRGFYLDTENERNSIYVLDGNVIINEVPVDED